MASRTTNGYEVTGPKVEKRGIPVFGAALAYAMHQAARLAPEVGTMYVRQGDRVVAYAERIESGSVVSRVQGSEEA